MIKTAAAYALLALLLAEAACSMSRASEYRPTKTYFASFSARAASGHREYFVIPFAAWNRLECENGTGPLTAVSDWLAHHPDWSEPRDIHCARPGEAEL